MSNANNANKTTNAATEATAKVAGAVLDTVLAAATHDEAQANIDKVKEANTVDPIEAASAENNTATAALPVDWSNVAGSALMGAVACGISRGARKVIIGKINDDVEIEVEGLEEESWTSVVAHAASVAVVAGGLNIVAQKTFMKNIDSGYHAGISTIIGTTTNLGDAIFGDAIGVMVKGGGTKLTDIFKKEDVVVEDVIA